METGLYLAVFMSGKSGPRWQAWNAMSEAERQARDREGLAARDRAHADVLSARTDRSAPRCGSATGASPPHLRAVRQ